MPDRDYLVIGFAVEILKNTIESGKMSDRISYRVKKCREPHSYILEIEDSKLGKIYRLGIGEGIILDAPHKISHMVKMTIRHIILRDGEGVINAD